MFNRQGMLDSVARFMEVWPNRPIHDNPYGMALNHSWATWYLLDRLRPDVVVESGIWRGHSTWVIEQAAPEADIYSFDVDLSNRQYVSMRAKYFEHDLGEHDWSGVDKGNSVVFLDDHQDSYQRLKTLKWLGFDRMIFEDNHPVGLGDFYTLKYLQAGAGYPVEPVDVPAWRRARRRTRHFLVRRGLLDGGQPRVEPNTHDWANAQSRISVMQEMPAVHVGSTRYYQGQAYEDIGGKPDELIPEVPFPDEDYRYNWLTYVELKRG